MEHHQKNKRAREFDNDDEAESKRIMPCLENNNNKNGNKRDVCGISFTNMEKNEMEEKKSCLALGVFDFPWLKDGVTFKYVDNFMDFEDNFFSSLEGNNKDTFVNVTSGFDFFDENGLCEGSMASIPEAKLVEDEWPFEGNELELEAEEVDCIWSSLT